MSKPLSDQASLLLDWLNVAPHRRISTLLAHMTLGIASLTSRVSELSKAGVPLKSEWEVDHLQRRFKSYWLESPHVHK